MVKVISIGPDEGSEFVDTIKNKNACVYYHMKGCPYCNQMQQPWKDLGKKLKEEYEGDVLLIDVDSEALKSAECEATEGIDGFPTIRIVENGKRKVDFNGDKTLEDMLGFMIQNLKDIKKKNHLQGGGFKKNKSRRRKNRKNSKSRRGRSKYGKRKRKTRKTKRRT
jgi:hypothetical protein